MRKRTSFFIILALIVGALKWAGVEIRTGAAEAASEIKTPPRIESPVSIQRRSPPILREKSVARPASARIAAENINSYEVPLRRVTDQEIYCRLLAAGVDVDDRNLKLIHAQGGYTTAGEFYFTAYVQTSSCPRGSFSRYEIDKNGEVADAIDCHQLTAEIQALTSGVQGAIEYLGPEKNRVNAALSGAGMFVIRCEDEVRYVRRGQWRINPDLSLSATPENCQVLDRKGEVFRVGNESELSSEGCNSQGECLALVRPQEGEFRVLDRETFLALNDDPINLATSPEDLKIFTASRERLEDPKVGILGPDFEALRVLDKPAWCPDKF